MTPRNAVGACFLWQLLTSRLSWEDRARRHISECHLNLSEYLLTFIHIFPVPGSASKGLSNVQFGSIDDNSAPPSTSPAAPSTLTDPKQVRTFGSISATPKPATASASPTVTKSAVSLPGSSSTAASNAGQTVKRKLDIHKLFQQPSGGTSESAPPSAVPSTPTQVAPATPQDSIPPRLPALQSNTFEPANARNSPSFRNTPLPSQGGQPAGPPQNGPIYPAPHLRQPNGVSSPRSSNFTRGLSNNGSHRGPPGTQPGVLGSPRMVPPATPQQQMPTLPNMPMQNGMPNGPAVGGPHVPGQVPQPVPGQVPHGMGMPGMPPPMMQWPGPYPYVGSIPVEPIPYSPSITVPLLPLRPQHASTILARPTTASHATTTSETTYSTANSDAAPPYASHAFPVSSTNLSTAFPCYQPEYHRPSNSFNSFDAYAHHHWQSSSIECRAVSTAKQAHRLGFASWARRRADGHQSSCCRQEEGRGSR